ncbi:hypothetical protein AGLY_017797, partial [Aphis glycines]
MYIEISSDEEIEKELRGKKILIIRLDIHILSDFEIKIVKKREENMQTYQLNKEMITKLMLLLQKKSRQIQVKRPCILILDSLSGGVHRARITATLHDWLKQEYIAKYNGKIKDFSPQVIKGALKRTKCKILKQDLQSKITLNISDCNMLNSGKYVNDKLIEFYSKYTLKLSEENRNRTYVFIKSGMHYTGFTFLCLFAVNMCAYCSRKNEYHLRHDQAKRWTKIVDTFEKDFVFFPINQNNHWFVAVICYPYLSVPVGTNT